ncbi:DUF6894 family protein [Jiella sonneratiae]|uniref:DUF6894 domain-containing protein n=1 Tax=Jiella sonneratiae TaxID=2816856 RepID=A0ABS3JBK9_9HYPH|nr:hypothetical protein [Jiella sonneratiae]MBO0906520.1 hypothetical protein [Jiella sonneratiae]
MAVFFFDTFVDGTTIPDEDGLGFEPQAVERIALAALAEMIRELVVGDPAQNVGIRVRDEHGNRVFEAALNICNTSPNTQKRM